MGIVIAIDGPAGAGEAGGVLGGRRTERRKHRGEGQPI